VVIIPFVIAVVSGFLGFVQFRDALTFDFRASTVTLTQSKALRLVLDEETGIRGFAVTGDRRFLDPYLAAVPQMPAVLSDLERMVLDIGLANGWELVYPMQRLETAWLNEVAKPLLRGGASAAQQHVIELHGKVLIDSYREHNRIMSTAMNQLLTMNRKSYAARFSRIASLMVVSVLMCAVGMILAWRKLLHGERIQAALRDRESLYEQDRAWSRSFQLALLPPCLPVIVGCQFDAVYEPGVSEAQVGGDWYDALRLADGRIMISIGDVAGSGHEAAVVMGVVRQIMRGIAQLHANPAVMLDAADRALRLEHPDVFVTAWVGIVDLVARTLTFGSAGHPPALLALRNGKIEELSDYGLPLGLRQGHQKTSTTVELVDGSTLVLYTDGLSEANHDVVAGLKRVSFATGIVAAGPWVSPAREIYCLSLDNAATDDVAILVTRFNFTEVDMQVQRYAFNVYDVSAARQGRDMLLARLTERGFPMMERLNAELVFSELISNVYRHAASEVDIAIDCSGFQTVLHVLDRGLGFRHESALPPDLYSETGRGVFLISEMSDAFTVSERFGGGSHARVVLAGRLSRAFVDGKPKDLVSLSKV